MNDFLRIPATANRNSALKFLMGRISFLRKLERRPVFLRQPCTGCHKCIKICPVEAIKPSPSDSRHIVLTDSKCIRCFCCAEACQDDAIDVRVKLFGV
jgi:ferredoxin